jgi:hypothetical protein
VLKWKNVWDKNWRKNQNIHFMSNNGFPQNHVLYEITWTNVGELETPQLTVSCGAHALHTG